MDDGVELVRRLLEGLGPTNRIARQLVNRLELAEDRAEEAQVISDELEDIWDVVEALGAWVTAAIDELEGLGPTNRIARQLVNRLELAEDRAEEAQVISDELEDIWDVVEALGAWLTAAIDEGVEAAEDHANRR